MLLKSWWDRITKLFAQEADAIGKTFHKQNSPGIFGIAPFGQVSFAGTVATIQDFSIPGERLYSALALMDSYYDNDIDFSTAAGGGPAAAGTYDLYIDAKEVDLGGGQMEYQAWLRYAATGTIDETIYLVVRTGVAWDGAAITSNGASDIEDRFGMMDLIELGKGKEDNVDLSTGSRGLILPDNTYVPDSAEVHLGAGAVVNASAPLAKIKIFFGALLEIFGLATIESTGELQVKSGGELNVKSGGYVGVESGAVQDVKSGGVLNIEGDLDIESGGNAEVKSGGLFTMATGCKMIMGSADFAGTPDAEQFLPQCAPKALGIIATGIPPTITWGINIDSVSKPAQGTYRIVLKRGFTDATKFFALAVSINGVSLFGVYVQVNTTTFDVKFYDDTGSLQDTNFGVAVFGADQT